MTTLTISGPFVDRDGLVRQTEYGWDGHRATMTRTFSAEPAREYRSTHPARIPVNVAHRGPDIGQVVHLEEDGGGALNAVAVVEGPACLELLKSSSGPWYWSAEIDIRDGGRDIELTGLAVTDKPAYVGLRPLEVHLDDIRETAWRSRQSFLNPHQMLTRAAATYQRRRFRHGEPMVIDGHDDPPTAYERRMDARALGHDSGRWITLPDGRAAEVEIRPAQIIGAS